MAASTADSEAIYNSPLSTSGQDEVWDELLPYLALGWAPAYTRGTRAMCALYALTDALNAHRIINEDLDTRYIHFTFTQIENVFGSMEYKARVEQIASEFPKTLSNPDPDPAQAKALHDHIYEEYMQENWLNQEQIGLVLELINEHLGLHYRLGIITSRQRPAGTKEAQPPTAYIYNRPSGGGPVIWLYCYGLMTHWEAIVPDAPLTNDPRCDYKQWGFEARAADLVAQGLFLVIKDVAGGDDADVATGDAPMALLRGQFVTRQDYPADWDADDAEDGWFWGQLPSLRVLGPGGVQATDVPLQPRVGPVFETTVDEITAVVPQGPKSGKTARPQERSGPDATRMQTPGGTGSQFTSGSGGRPGGTGQQTPAPSKYTSGSGAGRPGGNGLQTPAPSTYRPQRHSKTPGQRHTPRPGSRRGGGRRSQRTRTSKSYQPDDPSWKAGSTDPTRRQPEYDDPPGTLRMYFATSAVYTGDPRSRILDCFENELLLKVDHEDLAYPRMRDVNLVEGYVPVENLERIRNPWGVHEIMPTRGHPDFDSMSYAELKVIAAQKGVRPGGSTRSCKRNILANKRQRDLAAAEAICDDLPICKLRASYRPHVPGYDPTLKNATHNCRYVLLTEWNDDGTANVTNIDGYSAAIDLDYLLDEVQHWGLSVPKDTTFPQAVTNPDSPEPLYVKDDSSDSRSSDGRDGYDDDPYDDGYDDGYGRGYDEGSYGGGGGGRRSGGGGGGGGGGGWGGGGSGGRGGGGSGGRGGGGWGGSGGIGNLTPTAQCGVDGVNGALTALRNALRIVNLEIRSSPPDADNTQAYQLAVMINGYIREANAWLNDIDHRAPRTTSTGLPAAPPGFNFKSFFGKAVTPVGMVLLTWLACKMLTTGIKGANASAIPDSDMVESDLIPRDSYTSRLAAILGMGSTLGQYSASQLSLPRSRKRSFDETALETEGEPMSRKFKTRR